MYQEREESNTENRKTSPYYLNIILFVVVFYVFFVQLVINVRTDFQAVKMSLTLSDKVI